MTSYALIHGGCHGSWCFDRLVPLLAERGHVSLAIDLPYHDPGVSLAELGERAMTVFAQLSGNVVVVGHSMGRLLAPLLARARPVAGLVLLCAAVPEPGRSFAEQNLDGSMPGPSIVPREALTVADGVSRFASEDDLRTYLYQDCDDATVRWAWERVGVMAS